MKYEAEQFQRKLGERIKRLRLERGIVPRRMVHDYGMHLNQIAKAEHGEDGRMATLLKFCDAFGMTIEELLHDLA